MKAASNKLWDDAFKSSGSWRDVRHLRAGSIGLIQSGTIHLRAWVDHVILRAVYAQSTNVASVDGCINGGCPRIGLMLL